MGRKKNSAYPNATPMVNKTTAAYLIWHVINAKAITNIAGKRVPRLLKNFLVFVVVRIFFRTNISARKPDKFVLNHRNIYGKAERSPF